MKIIETYLRGKNKSNTGCEDGYFINDDFIVVVDGATSRNQCLWNGKASGEFTKDIVLATMELVKRDIDCHMLFQQFHQALNMQVQQRTALHLSEQLRASVLLYSEYYHEIWCLGDCNFIINGKLYDNGKKVDSAIAEVRSMLISSLLAEGMTEEALLDKDVSRTMIEPLIDRQYYLENQDCEYGYPELNSSSIDYNMIKRIRVKNGDCIILASDGYPELKETLAESETALQRQLREDPLCYKLHKSTKGLQGDRVSFDDRCYVRFEV